MAEGRDGVSSLSRVLQKVETRGLEAEMPPPRAPPTSSVVPWLESCNQACCHDSRQLGPEMPADSA